MKVIIKNLFPVEQGEIDLKDLTVFCGPNNMGKTYVMYMLYSLLDKDFEVQFEELIPYTEALIQKGTCEIDIQNLLDDNTINSMVKQIEKAFVKRLPIVFNVEESDFEKTEIKLEFEQILFEASLQKSWKSTLSLGKEKDWIIDIEKPIDETKIFITLRDSNLPKRIINSFISEFIVKSLFSDISYRSLLLPAERTGLNLFFQELSSKRTRLLHHAQRDKIDPLEVLRDVFKASYAEPITDYIEFLEDTNQTKRKTSKYKIYAQEIQKNILNGKYELDRHGNIYFIPYRSGQKKLSLHRASSTVKSFFGLVFFLEHLAEKSDVIMIDEPELNLHPDNQRLVTRIIAKLVNGGIKVIVSTHSDYFIKELSNLIMLSQQKME
ncbi:AAA family ATPase, partial [Candidatus Albibeggiatoa sp. nov. BB20]|uniref:AAA family ATPase n=1 Tax=Candidatus Albibeggiatoa sp. nov. BB20 TaxID=3162723 RepID=UPI0033656B8A